MVGFQQNEKRLLDVSAAPKKCFLVMEYEPMMNRYMHKFTYKHRMNIKKCFLKMYCCRRLSSSTQRMPSPINVLLLLFRKN